MENADDDYNGVEKTAQHSLFVNFLKKGYSNMFKK